MSVQISGLDSSHHEETVFPNAFIVKKKEEQRNKKVGVPGKRWGHSSIIYNNKLYLFGGTCGNPKQASNLYALSCETLQWERITLHESSLPNPNSRDSQSLVLIGNVVYIYGGSSQDETLSDFYAFDLLKNMWSIVEATGDSPGPREGHSTVEYGGKGFYLFGGSNGNKNFNSLYFFDVTTKDWKFIQNGEKEQPSPRENFSLFTLQDHIWLFGGQALANNKEIFYDDLWKMTLNESGRCDWQKVIPNSIRSPLPRASQTANVYKDRYIVIVGGETMPPQNNLQDENNEKDDMATPFSPLADIWLYDTTLNLWTSIIPKNKFVFSPRSAHSSSLFCDSLLIYGGLTENHEFSNELFELTFECNDRLIYNICHKKELQLCTYCKTALLTEEVLSDKDSEISFFEGKNLFEVLEKSGVSIDFISNISSLISWPIASFGLLIDIFILNQAKNINISWKAAKPRITQEDILSGNGRYSRILDVIIISEDGDSFSYTDFITMMASFKWRVESTTTNFSETKSDKSDDEEDERLKKLREYGTLLKIASLRLGHSFIFISRKKNEISMAFISDLKLKNPSAAHSFVYISAWDIDSGKFLTPDGKYFKKIILDSVSFYFTEDILIPAHDVNMVLIFDLKRVPNNREEFETELVCKNNDIQLRYSSSTFETIDLTKFIDFSLIAYINCLYLNPVGPKVFVNQNYIEMGTYTKTLNTCVERNIIKKIDVLLSDQDCLMFPTKFIYVTLGFFETKFEMRQEVMDKVANLITQKNNEPILIEEEEEVAEMQEAKVEKKVSVVNLSDESLQGVLIYYQNRLVGRLQKRRFGNILEHISKTHEKSILKGNNSVFRENGTLILSEILKPNPFFTVILLKIGYCE